MTMRVYIAAAAQLRVAELSATQSVAAGFEWTA